MKVIFLDADGTLFHHEGYIPSSSIMACQKAKEKGHKIVLCTGRQMAEIFGDMLKIDYDAIIAGSGATIECEHKIIEENSFSKDEQMYLIQYLQSNHIPSSYETKDAIYVDQETKALMKQMVEEQTKDLNEVDKKRHAMNVLYHQAYITDNPFQLKLNKVSFIDDHKISYDKIYEDLQKKFDVIPATFAPLGKESGEIGSYSITKATGMESVIKYFNVDYEDTIAFGDGHNDLKMFEKAAYSVAMGNACKELKDKADDITTDIDQDGIYNAFKKLNLI